VSALGDRLALAQAASAEAAAETSAAAHILALRNCTHGCHSLMVSE
jgi:hypothetical protein